MKSMDLLVGVEKDDLGRGVTRRVLETVQNDYLEDFKSRDEFELSCVFMRRLQALSVDPETFIVSDRWALDELAYCMVKMKMKEESLQESQILGLDGKPIFTQAHGELMMTQASFQTILNQVAIEKDFWDYIYYTPIYKSEEIVEDGIRPKDRLYQREVDLALHRLIDQLQLPVITVPEKFEDSFSFLEEESVKWMK